MKGTIIIITIFLALCMSQISMADPAPNARTVWPDAVTFSKLQMTRLDVKDPSYKNRLKNIRSTGSRSIFHNWESLIDRSL